MSQVQVIPPSAPSLATGTQPLAMGGRQGETVVSQLFGRYYQASRSNMMYYSFCALQAMSVPATAAIGNIVWNPPGSGVNLVICKVAVRIVATSATDTGVDLCHSAQATAPTTATVATTTGATFLGGAASVAIAYSIGTITTVAAVICPILHNTAAIATTGVDSVVVDFEGCVICPPGRLVSLHAKAAAGAASSTDSCIFWQEVPV